MDSVSQLLNHLEEARQVRNEDCVGLLRELTPHLHAARAVERELDRHLARRFNVFRYLRDDELGLSQVIADLLDPEGEHGQGATYLEAMLELLEPPELPEPLEIARATSHSGRVRVVTERGFDGRFIDITVDIPTDGGTFCLAFENKPYAGDQHRQCIDYLESLKKEYGKRFLLVYLPPRYRMPDESSLPLADYRKRWTNHFRVLPYVSDDASHGDDGPSDEDGGTLVQADSGADDARTDGDSLAEDDSPNGDDMRAEDDALAEGNTTDHETMAAHADAVVGDGASLADWFGTCRKLSEAERLRWFLREAQLYCQGRFGGSTVTDTEVRYIREYLHQNPRHLHAASAVARAWPGVRDDVCRRFLEHLRDRVEKRVLDEMPEIREGLRVDCHYEGDKRWSNRLRLMRRIVIESEGPGPNSWYWGVLYPEPKTLREELLAALKRRGLSLPHAGDGWTQYEYLPRYGHWEHRVPELVQELDDGGGKITDYYVNGLLGIARKAIPAINEVELANQRPSASDDA